ncbi:MAG: hypothetical protein M3Q68_03235 [Actinomycetota bacterium]|nr:hypothetical protein [Actinomycetota bacterium]
MSDRSDDVAAGDEPATLQSRLEVADHDDPNGAGATDAAPAITEPVALLRHLEVSGRFHRDSRAGRVFHPGAVSLRENVSTNSLHVSVEDNRVAAHVDEVSPLAVSEGASRYSVPRAMAHNLAGMAQDLVSLLQGREGDHRCELDCEWLTSDAESAPHHAPLLDPRAATWSVQLEARVAGSLDEARLRSALGMALGRHVMERDCLEVVDCRDDDALNTARARLQSMAVSVSARPPLHVYLARHPGGDVLMLNINHAASDGLGALRVLHCIARAYAGEADPDAPLDFLADRDLPVRPASAPVSVLARSYKRTVERLRDTLTRPARLAADQPSDHPGYGFYLLALSAEETQRALDVERSGTTRNILMAAMHLTIGDWNLRHGRPGRRIGVLAPANLRPPEWQEDTVGNFSVTTRMSTSRRDRSSPASALKALATETARNKRTRTGIALIAGLQRAGLLALWAKQSIVVLQPLTDNRLLDAAMLCNLGWLDEAPRFGSDVGDTVELWFSTPARSPLTLCLGAVTVAGRLHLVFRYPHRLFGPDAARRFAECYVDHVRLVVDGHA